MGQAISIRSNSRPLFGPAVPERKTLSGPAYELELAAELDRRLKEKYRSYERAATRLDLRGERDAAKVLRKAADRVRLLRSMAGDGGEPETAAAAE